MPAHSERVVAVAIGVSSHMSRDVAADRPLEQTIAPSTNARPRMHSARRATIQERPMAGGEATRGKVAALVSGRTMGRASSATDALRSNQRFESGMRK